MLSGLLENLSVLSKSHVDGVLRDDDCWHLVATRQVETHCARFEMVVPMRQFWYAGELEWYAKHFDRMLTQNYRQQVKLSRGK